MSSETVERYARHLVLKEIGGGGQAALQEAKVAIVGAGGLGGVAALYLAAAGVGQLALIDDDRVSLSNLQRQIQFQSTDIGQVKVAILATRLMALNPDIITCIEPVHLTDINGLALLSGYDVVLDGVDDFQSRFAINRTCVDLALPLVSGALGRWEAQLAIFGSDRRGPCYQCWVPDAPSQMQTCAQVGVVGALAGFVGTRMALETIKLIVGAGETLRDKLWLFDGLTMKSRIVNLRRDPACPACAG